MKFERLFICLHQLVGLSMKLYRRTFLTLYVAKLFIFPTAALPVALGCASFQPQVLPISLGVVDRSRKMKHSPNSFRDQKELVLV